MQFYKQAQGLFFSKKSFGYLVREIIHDNASPKLRDEIRIQKIALTALQCAAEFFICDVFSLAQLAAIHAKRETVMLQDMLLLYEIHKKNQGSIMQALKPGMAQYDEARKKEKARLNALAKTAKK